MRDILEQLGFNAYQLVVVKKPTVVIPARPPPQNFGPPLDPTRAVRHPPTKRLKRRSVKQIRQEEGEQFIKEEERRQSVRRPQQLQPLIDGEAERKRGRYNLRQSMSVPK